MQLITDTWFGAAGLMGRVLLTRVDAPLVSTPEWTVVEWPEAIISVPPTDLRMAFPSVVHPGRPGGRRALTAPAQPRPPNIGTGFHRGSHWTRELATPLTRRVAQDDRQSRLFWFLKGYLTLYFSEVTCAIHGPMQFAPDERVQIIHQWLEEETFGSRCVDEETNEWLAHVEISTSCGMVLDLCRNLPDYHPIVSEGDTLTVILVPEEALSE